MNKFAGLAAFWRGKKGEEREEIMGGFIGDVSWRRGLGFRGAIGDRRVGGEAVLGLGSGQRRKMAVIGGATQSAAEREERRYRFGRGRWAVGRNEASTKRFPRGHLLLFFVLSFFFFCFLFSFISFAK
jgi:hypothetical protein